MNKEKLKEYCEEVGIPLVGIASVDKYSELEKILKNRLANGYVTGMEEPDLIKRLNPKETMENVKSIIVCMFPYYKEPTTKSNISKYCQGEDYHIVAKDYMQNICDKLEEEIKGFEYKLFVDNGPLVDRYLAYISGIGYFGINNNIITDKYGSYVFIGYIMNNFEFAPDEPSVKTCIKCGKCVRYCPGNAILGEFEMNPKRCISYITQKKGELSKEEIDTLKEGESVFGCDICQDVCPHNLNIQETPIDRFKENMITSLSEEEINEISNKEFKRRYGNRAFSWRGKGIIKRNFEKM